MTKHNSWTSHLSTTAIINLATLGPIGHLKYAPGTAGSLAGLLFYFLFFYTMHPLAFFIALALLIYFSIAICSEAEIRMGRKDPPEIVLDEFAAVPICFIGLESKMHQYPIAFIVICAFALFRYFDIKKPFFIHKLQNIRGGWGVVLDDIAAAVLTNIILQLLFIAIRLFTK